MNQTVSRTFTLNRAHKVVQRLKELVAGEERGLGAGYTGNVGFGAQSDRVIAKGRNQAVSDIAKLEKVLALHQLVGLNRDTIAKANVAANVTTLMAEERWVQAQIGTLRTQLAYLGRGIDEHEYLQQAKERAAELAAYKELIAAGVVNAAKPSEHSVTLNYVQPSVIERLQLLMKGLEARKVFVADAISDANAEKVSLELPVEYLKELLGE